MRAFLAILALHLVPAHAATFSYAGTALSPAKGAGTGANSVTLAFTARQAPKAGKCVLAQRLRYYTDGARTWTMLRKAGYKLITHGDTGPVTYARVCLDAGGTRVSGAYNILAEYNNGIVLQDLIVTNTANGGDLVEFQEYLGGVPHIYADMSAATGTWVITP